MILISFPALKASINCLKKSIGPVLTLCESLNDTLTPLIHCRYRNRVREKHTIGANVYKCHIDMSISSLGVWCCLFQPASSWVNKMKRLMGNTHTQVQARFTYMHRFDSAECDLIQISLIPQTQYHMTTRWASEWLHSCFGKLRDWIKNWSCLQHPWWDLR